MPQIFQILKFKLDNSHELLRRLPVLMRTSVRSAFFSIKTELLILKVKLWKLEHFYSKFDEYFDLIINFRDICKKLRSPAIWPYSTKTSAFFISSQFTLCTNFLVVIMTQRNIELHSCGVSFTINIKWTWVVVHLVWTKIKYPLYELYYGKL